MEFYKCLTCSYITYNIKEMEKHIKENVIPLDKYRATFEISFIVITSRNGSE